MDTSLRKGPYTRTKEVRTFEEKVIASNLALDESAQIILQELMELDEEKNRIEANQHRLRSELHTVRQAHLRGIDKYMQLQRMKHRFRNDKLERLREYMRVKKIVDKKKDKN